MIVSNKSDNVVMFIVFLSLCLLGINGKPSLSFNLPQIGPLGYLSGKEQTHTLKTYSGRRVDANSIRMVYFNDLTVAIVELGHNKLLLNCELIEILDTDQVFDVLGELKDVARPVGITLPEMLTLMSQCKELADTTYLSQHREIFKNNSNSPTSKSLNNPFTLLNGIIPGTKWCGTGDIAADYFDLGTEANVDACCRAHDLCPVKIRGRKKRYNLTNNSIYTKSLCICDDDLFRCLKNTRSNTAHLLGNIYFNLVQVPCVAQTKNGRSFRNARNNF